MPFVAAATLQELPEAAGQSTLAGAPLDSEHGRDTLGLVVHPRAPLPVFGSPAGTAFARIRSVLPVGETWLPVIEQQPGWVRVLLPSRPRGTTGWLDATRVTSARSRYDIQIDFGASVLRLLYDSRPVATWPASFGALRASIPPGRTFLLASVRRTQLTPLLLLRLAAHVEDRNPGLLTIHAEPADHSEPINRGCMRVPERAMTALGVVPPGGIVRIEAG
ncbi:hypothetical protein [Actinoplanes sp. NPDC049118]|uniref:hypothetical protein n=1 Tax=Actinoplanes sp. NPDC049118 TaxID=3155769 RepID=UPI0033D8C821